MFGPIEVDMFMGTDTEYWSYPLTHAFTGIGIILGLEALRRNLKHKQAGQIVPWVFWLIICGLDLLMLNAVLGRDAFDKGEWVLAAIMRLVWLWMLINWIFAPKGSSWSIYPATPDESTEEEVELDLANLVNN
jgi:hypothetical protein